MQTNEAGLKAMMIGALDGETAANEALLRALVPLLRNFYGRRLPGAEHDVEDLVQETLISVHTRRTTYDRERRFTPWLYAVARHRLIDHVRRTRVTVPLEDVKTILIAEGFEEATTARIDLDDLLSNISPKQARAIRDVHIEGLSAAECAKRSEMGESDVRVSIHRGLKALSARIRGDRL